MIVQLRLQLHNLLPYYIFAESTQKQNLAIYLNGQHFHKEFNFIISFSTKSSCLVQLSTN